MKNSVGAAALLGRALAVPAGAAGESIFPTRPNCVIVPWRAGGQTDLLARLIQTRLAEALGQPVAVDNRAGPWGTVGAVPMAVASADGHTIKAHAVSLVLSQKLPHDTARDFVGVSRMGSVPNVRVVASSPGVRTAKVLIALARRKPGQINFTSAGSGGGTHIDAEQFKATAAISVVRVPNRGTPEALVEVTAGRVQYSFAPLGSALPFLKDGELLGLAVSTIDRTPILPEVPTFAEAAAWPGFYFDRRYVMFASAKTPHRIVDWRFADARRIIDSPDIRQRMAAQGEGARASTPEEPDGVLRLEFERLGKVVGDSGARIIDGAARAMPDRGDSHVRRRRVLAALAASAAGAWGARLQAATAPVGAGPPPTDLPHAEGDAFTGAPAQRLRDRLAELDTTGMRVLAGGRVAFDHGDVSHVSYLASVRKSVLAMLYGRYVQAGTIRLDATLETLGIDDVQGLTALERGATVEQLLAARSGIYHPAANRGDDTAFAPPRGTMRPGERHLYNNWDFNAAGAVFERATGIDVHDALAADLAGPLGMQDFERARQRKTGDLTASRHPAYHMLLSTRDMARLGLLMLRDGRWQGRELLPPGWAARITRLVTPHDELIAERRERLGPGQRWGYGWMWWVWDARWAGDPMAGSFDARGLFGQHITVVPRLDLVIAHKVDPRQGVAGERRRRVSASQYAGILRAVVEARCSEAVCG